MKQKTFIIFLLGVVTFVGVMVWQVDRYVYRDKLSWGESQARGQMSAVVPAAQLELRELQKSLLTAYSFMLQKSQLAYTRFDRLLYVAEVQIDSSVKISESMLPEASPFKNVQTQVLEKNFSFESLENVSQNLRQGKVVLISLPQIEGQSYFAFFSPVLGDKSSAINEEPFVSPKFAVGIYGPDIFQGLLDRQKGGLSQISVVNDAGVAIGHTVREYVGASMKDNSVVQQILSNPDQSQHAVWGSSLGSYEQIPQSNLFVALEISLDQLMQEKQILVFRFGLFGAGIVFIASAIVYLLLGRGQTGAQLVNSVTAVGANTDDYLVPDVEKPASKVPTHDKSFSKLHGKDTQPEQIPKSVREASKEISHAVRATAALTQELKAPMNSVLNQIQLAESKTTDPEVQKHLNAIQDEVIKTQGWVDELSKQSDGLIRNKERSECESVLESILNDMESDFFKNGIKLHKHFSGVGKVGGRDEDLIRVFRSILQNSIDAVKDSYKKEITVKTFPGLSDITVEISDSGIGIEKSEIDKIFDPFYTTKKETGNVGLGLSFVQNFMNDIGGRVSVYSHVGEGTAFSLSFPREITAETPPIPTDEFVFSVESGFVEAAVAPPPTPEVAVGKQTGGTKSMNAKEKSQKSTQDGEFEFSFLDENSGDGIEFNEAELAPPPDLDIKSALSLDENDNDENKPQEIEVKQNISSKIVVAPTIHIQKNSKLDLFTPEIRRPGAPRGS